MFELSSTDSLVPSESCDLTAVGDMDLFAASALRRALGRQSRDGVDTIRVDLSQVTWVNGSALRHMATTRRFLDLLGVDLDLADWSAAVTRMSTRARLDGALGRAVAAA